MSDFPAAHSMDTNWFAVDADGNVGVFDSGENGAVPRFLQYFRQASRIELIEEFFKLFPKDEQGIIHLKTEGKKILQDASLKDFRKFLLTRGTSLDLLLVVSSPEVIPKLKFGNSLILQFSGFPIVVYVGECQNKVIKSLIESGEILRRKEFELQHDLAHHLGLFSYEVYETIPTPYLREEVPVQPLKLQELPEKLQQYLANSHFQNIRFSETEIIQPIEHTRCNFWGGTDRWITWIDSEGNRRKNHGREL